MAWIKDNKSHTVVKYGADIKTPFIEVNNNKIQTKNNALYIPLPQEATSLLAKSELHTIKRALKHKFTAFPLDKNTMVYVYKPKKGTGLPLSPEFIATFIKTYIPEKDRKGIKKIVFMNYIKGSAAEYLQSLGEYFPPDTIAIYYQTINDDGTYSISNFTREEYINKLLFDVIPHEIGHSIDCERYTKKTKKSCIPNEMHERSARAYADEFRKKWKIPDAWYFTTNRYPKDISSPMEFALYLKKKKKLK